MRITKILLPVALVCAFANGVHATDAESVRTIMKNFERAWNEKNTTLLYSCFHKLHPQQKAAFKAIFDIAKNVDVTVTIRSMMVKSPYGAVRVETRKKLNYDIQGKYYSGKETTAEYNYVFEKRDGKWGIIGTIDPAATYSRFAVTEQNIDIVNQILRQLPEEERRLALKSFVTNRAVYLTASNRTASWPAVGGALRYVTTIVPAKPKTERDALTNFIWRADVAVKAEVEIPADVVLNLRTGVSYWFCASAYDFHGDVMGISIIEIRSGVGI